MYVVYGNKWLGQSTTVSSKSLFSITRTLNLSFSTSPGNITATVLLFVVIFCFCHFYKGYKGMKDLPVIGVPRTEGGLNSSVIPIGVLFTRSFDDSFSVHARLILSDIS